MRYVTRTRPLAQSKHSVVRKSMRPAKCKPEATLPGHLKRPRTSLSCSTSRTKVNGCTRDIYISARYTIYNTTNGSLWFALNRVVTFSGRMKLLRTTKTPLLNGEKCWSKFLPGTVICHKGHLYITNPCL